MGMHYNVTFHGATIPADRFADAAGWTPEQVAADPEGLAAAALTAVNEYLDDFDSAELDEEGIHLDGIGFHDTGSYGRGEEYLRILGLCEPGGYIHEIDEETSSSEFWRYLVKPDRTIATIYPVVTWPDMPDE